MAAKPNVKNKHLMQAESVFQFSGSQFFIKPLGGISLQKPQGSDCWDVLEKIPRD